MHVVTLKVVLSCAERHECKGYQKQFNTRWGLTLIFHDNNIVVLQEGKNKFLLARRTTSLRVCACLKNARIELMYGPKFIMNMIIKQSPFVQIIGPVLLLLPLGVIQALSESSQECYSSWNGPALVSPGCAELFSAAYRAKFCLWFRAVP